MSEICTCRKSVGWFCSFWIKWYPILHVSPVLVKSMIDIGSHSSVVFFKMSRFCDPYCIHNATSITLFGHFFIPIVHCLIVEHILAHDLDFFHLGCCLEFSKPWSLIGWFWSLSWFPIGWNWKYWMLIGCRRNTCPTGKFIWSRCWGGSLNLWTPDNNGLHLDEEYVCLT